MNNIDKIYQKELLRRLLDNPYLAKEKEIFDQILGKPIWLILSRGDEKAIEAKKSNFLQCGLSKHSLPEQAQCIKALATVLKKAQRTKKPQQFTCPIGGKGFCLPLVPGDRVYGFIEICNLKKPITPELLSLFSAFTEAIIKEVQRELELAKLYETIRPRAIALSTIHTVHRLISSTLDLDELLPRIARLSLQVLRAKQCYIMLLEKNKKFLVPHAVVDLKNKNTISNKGNIKVRVGLEGRAAAESHAILKPDKLAVPLVSEEVIGVISVYHKQNGRPFSIFDQEILSTLAEQAVIAIKNAQLYKQQEKITLGSIKSLAAILDTKSPSIYTHTNLFVNLVLGIGRELNLSKEDLHVLHYAALLPETGKIGIPEEILKKPSRLTGSEYRLIKKHPLKGAELIEPLEVLKPTIPFILHHHEKYDGTGYPDKLKAEQIPLGARIMAVADAFEAMVCKRPYRKRLLLSKAVLEIKKNSGTQFDPKVVEAFLKVIKKLGIKNLNQK